MTAPLQNPWPHLERIAVLGLGRSGVAVANLLARFPFALILSDVAQNPPPNLPPGASLTLGQNTLGDAQLAVISPGLPIDHPIVKEAHLRAIPLVSELDLGARMISKPILAITGTDGKTTTTSLCAHLIERAGFKTGAVGNIGTPLCEVVEAANTWDVVVVETSAFQLWNAPSFRPHVLIATNIAPDHLDYFLGDLAYYARTKRRPLDVMTSDGWVVLNAHDPEIRSWPRFTEAQVAWFALDPSLIPASASAWATVRDGVLTVCHQHEVHAVLPVAELLLKGDHNVLNALSASLGVVLSGVPAGHLAQALATFTPPPHRIQTVLEHQGVRFIDDSKATNPHAASAALKAVEGRSVLIAGGVDKQLALDTWVGLMPDRVAAAVLIGELAPRLAECIARLAPGLAFQQAGSMEEAVLMAYKVAREVGARNVLLSPGCSSFDMFKSYGARGDAFKDAAQRLQLKQE